MSQPKIDFVITWVDGTDPKWLAEKLRTLQETDFSETQRTDSSDLRFRNDFDFLKFWFRGVENSPHGLIKFSLLPMDTRQTG